jgi:serine/threonine protein kinase
LGVVAYEVLTGRVPYAGDSVVTVLYAHVNLPPPDASHLRPDLPPEVDHVFRRALAKDPAARFDTGAEFVAALRTAAQLEGRPGVEQKGIAPLVDAPPKDSAQDRDRRVRPLEEEVQEREEQAKEDVGEFDVFLAHNSEDKPHVIAISEALKRRGLNPWLDIEQIPPGRWFQDVIQQAIPSVESAAVIIGPQGLGKWQTLELRAFIGQCVEQDIPVIPVLLPGVTQFPPQLLFLKGLTWVRFRESLDEVGVLDDLVWGITGLCPERA